MWIKAIRLFDKIITIHRLHLNAHYFKHSVLTLLIEIFSDPVMNLAMELMDLKLHLIRHDTYLDRKVLMVAIVLEFSFNRQYKI